MQQREQAEESFFSDDRHDQCRTDFVRLAGKRQPAIVLLRVADIGQLAVAIFNVAVAAHPAGQALIQYGADQPVALIRGRLLPRQYAFDHHPVFIEQKQAAFFRTGQTDRHLEGLLKRCIDHFLVGRCARDGYKMIEHPALGLIHGLFFLEALDFLQ